MEMTYNEAMTIQRAQMAYYRNAIGRPGIKAIRSRTWCPTWLNPNEPMSVIDINRYVPRGGSFERYITNHRYTTDGLNLAYSKAIRRGLI